MSTAARRIKALEVRRAQIERKSGAVGIIEEYRAWLETIDGQHDLDMRPGEDLYAVTRRRLQNTDGWDLSGMPGATLEEQDHSAELVAQGLLCVPPETRHAARHFIGMNKGI